MISKILDVLEINNFVFLQMAIVLVLTYITGKLLIHPILRTFEERENRTTRPMEEAKEMLARVEQLAEEYDRKLKEATQEALLRKRRRIEDVAKAEKKIIEEAQREAEARIEELKERIEKEKVEALEKLREETQTIAREIAEKILGRSVA